MRVLLDMSFAERGPSGTGVYLERLRVALADAGADVVEARDARRAPPAGGGLASVRNLARDLAWANAELPRLARRAGARVIHHPLPVPARPVRGVGRVVTVHDLAFVRHPELYDAGYRHWSTTAHRLSVRTADAVIAVSATTARDLRARWGVDPARIVVARHGPGQELPAVDRDPGLPPERFLYVGDDEPRKGLPVLLEAYAAYRATSAAPLPLVLAGSARAPGAEGVLEEHRPDPARLAELLAGGAALVHPAVHEGAGLTLVEAMRAGVPVIAARSPGVVETCAGAAELVDPGAPGPLAAALARLAGDPALRAGLAARGRARAAAFTWEHSAREHLRAYALALR